MQESGVSRHRSTKAHTSRILLWVEVIPPQPTQLRRQRHGTRLPRGKSVVVPGTDRPNTQLRRRLPRSSTVASSSGKTPWSVLAPGTELGPPALHLTIVSRPAVCANGESLFATPGPAGSSHRSRRDQRAARPRAALCEIIPSRGRQPVHCGAGGSGATESQG
jgi:hypothetical protein